MSLFYTLYYPCEKIRDFAYDHLDGKLPPLTSLRFHLHLRGCPECQEYLKLYRMAADGQAFRAANPPPPALLDETLAFLEKQGLVSPDAGDGTPEAGPPDAAGQT